MKHAVGIATTGRADVLTAVVTELAKQMTKPDGIFICGANREDVDRRRLEALDANITILFSDCGLTRQRNAILDQLTGFDIVTFFDDDFIPDKFYLEWIARAFTERPDAAMITGSVIADGSANAGISLAEALQIVATPRQETREELLAIFAAYGCNMSVRLARVFENRLRFNERFPLYGWLEDLDFSRRIAKHGAVLQATRARGVHMGVKKGRVSEVRNGYSQVANPICMFQDRIIPFSTVLAYAGRKIAANLIKSLASESFIDRRGRLRGNLYAVIDLFAGRLDPTRIVEL
ncbi:MAG: glycosyltransferase family 2 protein [Roseiarcus sp.]